MDIHDHEFKIEEFSIQEGNPPVLEIIERCQYQEEKYVGKISERDEQIYEMGESCHKVRSKTATPSKVIIKVQHGFGTTKTEITEWDLSQINSESHPTDDINRFLSQNEYRIEDIDLFFQNEYHDETVRVVIEKAHGKDIYTYIIFFEPE